MIFLFLNHLSITRLHAAAGMLVKLEGDSFQVEILLKNLWESSENQLSWWLRELKNCKHLVRGSVSYLFYWFSVCDICTIWDFRRLSLGWASDCQSHHLLFHPTRGLQETATVSPTWAGHCERNADNLLAMLPMKQRRCAEQYCLISLQFSLQPCQPDFSQSPRIKTSGLHQTITLHVKFVIRHFKTWNVDTFRC